MEVRKEIEGALGRLKISPSDFYLLSNLQGREIFQKSLDTFVKSGDRRWWWEDFHPGSFEFQPQKYPFRIISELIPSDRDKVWFVAQDEAEPFYPVYRARPRLISAVVGECFGFEYYIIDPEYRWLLCETHHHRILGVGDILKAHNQDRLLAK